MDVMQLAGSLIAILLVAYLAKYLFPNATPLTTERAIRNLKRYCPEIPDLHIENAHYFISETDDSAIALIPDDFGIAVLKQMGDRITVRHFDNISELSVEKTSDSVRVVMDDFTLASVKLKLTAEQIASILSVTNDTKETVHA
ncbi:hypothetical protein [Kordiimonas aquimaris]|uniref:hypothetical protein n=1 Tax=Kordiimonas aquimaris TaxID=707591 RepID=UPI0021D2DDA8|nr:hypothetical protein [Kordiimonas aquimaris]